MNRGISMSSEDTEIREKTDSEGDSTDKFSKYINENKIEEKPLKEYRIISNVEKVVVPIGLFVGLVAYIIIMTAITGEIGFLDFSDLESAALSISLVGVAGLVAVVPVWYVTDLSISHELDDRQLARHKLALSIEAYQESNIDETIERLEEVKDDLNGIAHPQLATVTSNLISNYADPNDPDSIDLIMRDYVGHIIEGDHHAKIGSEISENLQYKDQGDVTYYGVFLKDIQTRFSGTARDLVFLSILAIGVLVIYFYISQNLAGVLSALVATFGTYILAQRK